jgi:hypothetical protein
VPPTLEERGERYTTAQDVVKRVCPLTFLSLSARPTAKAIVDAQFQGQFQGSDPLTSAHTSRHLLARKSKQCRGLLSLLQGMRIGSFHATRSSDRAGSISKFSQWRPRNWASTSTGNCDSYHQCPPPPNQTGAGHVSRGGGRTLKDLEEFLAPPDRNRTQALGGGDTHTGDSCRNCLYNIRNRCGRYKEVICVITCQVIRASFRGHLRRHCKSSSPCRLRLSGGTGHPPL